MKRRAVAVLLATLAVALLPAATGRAATAPIQINASAQRAAGGTALVVGFTLACSNQSNLQGATVTQKGTDGTVLAVPASVAPTPKCDGVRRTYRAIALASAFVGATTTWSFATAYVEVSLGDGTTGRRFVSVTDPSARIAGHGLTPGVTASVGSVLRRAQGAVAIVRIPLRCPAGAVFTADNVWLVQAQGGRAIVGSTSGGGIPSFAAMQKCDGTSHPLNVYVSPQFSPPWRTGPAFVLVQGFLSPCGGSGCEEDLWSEVTITN